MSRSTPSQLIPDVVNDYLAAINDLDLEAYAACFAPDAIAHEPVGGPPHQGQSQIKAFFAGTGGLFEQLQMRWTFVHVVGQEVALKWAAEGRGKNGQTVQFEGIDLWLLTPEGKIATLRGYWDAQSVVAKLL